MSSIQLNWNAVSPPGSTYTVLRNGAVLVTSLSATSYLDTTVADNTAYTYGVFAVNQNGTGLSSAPANAITPPSQVTGLTATPLSSSSIKTDWTATPGASTYTVKRGTSVVGTPATNTFTDTGLTPSTLYSYTVAANGAGGQGAFSASASATTQAAAGGAIKFHPSIAGWQIDYNQGLATQFSRMAALKAATPSTTNFEVQWDWSLLENPALVGGSAQYNGSWATGNQTQVANQRGFVLLDTFVAEARRLGCNLCVNVRGLGGHSNGGDQTSFPSAIPTYLSGTTYGPNANHATDGRWGAVWVNSYAGNGVQFTYYVRWWDPLVAPPIKAFLAGYGARYNLDPNVESFSFACADEMVVSTATGYNDAGAISTLTGASGIFASWYSSWSRTMGRVWANYFQATSTMDTILASAVQYKRSIGGPDMCNDFPITSANPARNSDGRFRSITAIWRWQGLTNSVGNGGVVNPALPNYVGVGNMHAEVEAEDTAYDPITNTIYNPSNRALGDGSLYNIVNQMNINGVTHAFWYDNQLQYGRPGNPCFVYTNSPHPNLCDWVESCARGGNVNINGITSGIALTNTTYPSTFPP